MWYVKKAIKIMKNLIYFVEQICGPSLTGHSIEKAQF